MKNVTVGECKTGKKKNKVQKRWRRMQVWKKKKTKFKSVGGECKSRKKKNKGQKPRKMIPLESEKKW